MGAIVAALVQARQMGRFRGNMGVSRGSETRAEGQVGERWRSGHQSSGCVTSARWSAAAASSASSAPTPSTSSVRD